MENAFIESFNGRLRDECLNSHVFTFVVEAQVVLDAWREDYNLVRPHSSLQDRTPRGPLTIRVAAEGGRSCAMNTVESRRCDVARNIHRGITPA